MSKVRFSRYAQSYDEYCGVQNESARILLSYLPKRGFSRILDIGCGTGNLAVLLKKSYPDSHITALDISSSMIEVSKGKLGSERIEYIVEDARRLDRKDQFDLVASNAVFHWIDKKEAVLERCRESMVCGGWLLCSVYGPETFKELDTVLRDLFGRDSGVTASYFDGLESLKSFFGSSFFHIKADERIIKQEHGSLGELLTQIKYTGVGGSGAMDGKLWTRQRLNEIEKVYIEYFGRIVSTYQIFFIRGVK